MIAPADFSAPLSDVRAKTALADRAATSQQEAKLDAELVRRFHAGDEAAFVEIVQRYRQRMFTIALGMLHNHADTEEIAQDTFVRAHRGLARFRGDSSLATWLHRITLNLARNRYWYFFRRQRHATLSLDDAIGHADKGAFFEIMATAAAGPAREAVSKEFSTLVAECMTKLSAGQCEILTLRNTLDRSYEEISRQLGINIGTVKSRIARARETLRALLVKACPEFGEQARPADWFEALRPAGGVDVFCA